MELPEDIVGRILSKLHPLEAVKAKLVCRTWRRLIPTLRVPSWALGFAIDSPCSSPTLLYADLSCSRWMRFPLLDEPASLLAIAGSFLCLSTTSSSKPHVTQLHLLNPLTHAHVCIPPSHSRVAPYLVGLFTGSPISGFKKSRIVDESWSMLGLSWPQELFPFTLWAWDGHLYMAGELSNALTVWKLAINKCHGHLLCIMLVWARKGVVYDLHSGPQGGNITSAAHKQTDLSCAVSCNPILQRVRWRVVTHRKFFGLPPPARRATPDVRLCPRLLFFSRLTRPLGSPFPRLLRLNQATAWDTFPRCSEPQKL
ncbi:hypothetical protein GOP47_0030214 [Adiantum capillus-veneris]|nr:hypothetical protein GOP47_0030214 [Adiantum capillus-veneris]